MIYYIFPYDFYDTYIFYIFVIFCDIYAILYDIHLYFTHFIWHILIYHTYQYDFSIVLWIHGKNNFSFRRNKKHWSLKHRSSLDTENYKGLFQLVFLLSSWNLAEENINRALKSDEPSAGSLVWWNKIHTSWQDKKNLNIKCSSARVGLLAPRQHALCVCTDHTSLGGYIPS